MVSKEEKELIEARKQWADTPIINFWHDTNDAPDAFFDELLSAARDEESTSTMSRTTTRTTGSAKKAKSSYGGHSVKSPQVKYPITNKKWGKFWEVVSAMNKSNGKRAAWIDSSIDRLIEMDPLIDGSFDGSIN